MRRSVKGLLRYAERVIGLLHTEDLREVFYICIAKTFESSSILRRHVGGLLR